MFASKAKLDPRKWDKTSTIIEVKLFDQFGIKVDDSGRVTLRNRKFLRCFTPIIPRIPSSHPHLHLLHFHLHTIQHINTHNHFHLHYTLVQSLHLKSHHHGDWANLLPTW